MLPRAGVWHDGGRNGERAWWLRAVIAAPRWLVLRGGHQRWRGMPGLRWPDLVVRRHGVQRRGLEVIARPTGDGGSYLRVVLSLVIVGVDGSAGWSRSDGAASVVWLVARGGPLTRVCARAGQIWDRGGSGSSPGR